MRVVIKVIAGVFVLYVLTFFLLGKHSMVNTLVQDSNATYKTYRWTNEVCIVSDIDLPGLIDIGKQVTDQNAKVSTVLGDHSKISTTKSDVYVYRLEFGRYSPYVSLTESEHIEEYTAIWRKEYVWVFFGWVLLSDTMIGVS